MIIKVISYVPAMILGWIAVLAAVMLLSPTAPAALVIGPISIPENAAFVADPWVGITLQSDEVGFVKQLYQNGAWLVLPAGLLGCGG